MKAWPWALAAYTTLLLCLWLIDVAVVALLHGSGLTNGFWSVDASMAYHVGLYGAVLSAIVLVAHRGR